MATDATDQSEDDPADARPDDAEIDRAAEVSDGDVDDAVRSWRTHAPAKWRGLISAELYED